MNYPGSEAFWLNFHSHSGQPFAIKIYVGGVNIISGENKSATHEQEYKVKNCKQDYIAVPGQQWLDGIPNPDGKVTQFPAAPTIGSGYSVEAQISGSDSLAGIQFEIIPTFLGTVNNPDGGFQVLLKDLTGKTLTLQVNSSMTLWDVKNRIRDLQGIPPYKQTLIHAGWRLPKHLTLSEFNIQKESTLHLIMFMYIQRKTEEKTIFPVGLCRQPIQKDILAPQRYDWANRGIVNVQLFDPETFRTITEENEPSTPIMADIYALRFPFSKHYGEQGSVWERILDSIVAKSHDGLDHFWETTGNKDRSDASVEHGVVELNEVDRQSDFVARGYLESL
ncbi:hypothetical protein EAF04_001583 [Stromatinia cepivora]|nr:hypothetical protein EAF04_001583 [Stromatinia cepivora]